MATQTFYTKGDKKLQSGSNTSAIVQEFENERDALETAFQAVNDAIGAIDHGGLLGLADDDHTLYALADKSRPATWVEAGDLAPRAITDLGDVASKTGSGTAVVFGTSPTIVTPVIASFATAGHSHLNAAGGGTITEAAISDLGTAAALKADDLSVFAATTSAQLRGVLSDETGTGAAVFGTSPTIVTPVIASFATAGHSHEDAAGGAKLDHGLALNGLLDDDHTQYALLAGRAGSQTLTGGTAASEDLTLNSTINATKGNVNVGTDGSIVDIGSGASSLGVLGTAPITKAAAIAARADGTGGSTAGGLVAITAIGGSGATTAQEGEINDNFARLATTLEAVRSTMSAYGWY